jgi:hypothetical protein
MDRRGRWYLHRRVALRPGRHRLRAQIVFQGTRRTTRDVRAGFRACDRR